MISEIKSNEYLIIDSGNITSFDEKSDINFKIMVQSEKFEIFFEFIDDDTENVRLETKVNQNKIK